MKKSLLIPFALLASLPSLSAFSLDFNAFFESLEGGDYSFTTEDPSGFIAVSDFGDINFFLPDPIPENTEIPVGDNFGSGALEFVEGQVIAIQFLQNDDVSGTVTNVELTSISQGSEGGEGVFNFIPSNPGDPVVGLITWSGAPGGISVINFDTATVPEPSASLLGALGALVLLRRRR